MTRVASFCCRGVPLGEDVTVVVGQLLTWGDVADGLDPDPAILDHGVAVRITGVVDEASLVAVDRRIHDQIVIDGEQEGVMRLTGNVRVSLVCLGGRQPFTRILNESDTGGDVLGGEGADPVNSGRSELERPCSGDRLLHLGKIAVGRMRRARGGRSVR